MRPFVKIANRSKLLMLVALLVSMVFVLPQPNTANHNPILSINADIERHQLLDYVSTNGLPHSHDNGTHDESHFGHQHGHNSADHTHNPLFITIQDSWPSADKSIGPSEYQFSHSPPAPFLWQRPPKLALTA